MKSKNNNPTAEQKRFIKWVMQDGCVICRSPSENHHVKGSTYTHNKIKVGHWYILPLCANHHRNGQINATSNKTRFEQTFGSQKEMFHKLIDKYVYEKDEMPFSDDVMRAINDIY